MRFLSRPKINNIIILKNPRDISVRVSISLENIPKKQDFQTKEIHHQSSPWQNINLFNNNDFKVKVVCFDANSEIQYTRIFNTDRYGNLNLKIPTTHNQSEITSLQFFEVSYQDGIDLLLGSFIPVILNSPNKVIISDFDKTLVDTRYSTIQEMFTSLRNPISYFPTIDKSLEVLQLAIKSGYTPFILSASPHFYEKPFRDWLYQNEVYTSNIFLKDYRKIFSFFESELTPKDLKTQGFYKLTELINILLMTDLADKLILIGDGFESDPLVYLVLRALIIEKIDPWKIWKTLKKMEQFKLTRPQQTKLLTSLNLIAALASKKKISLKIYIRCFADNFEEIKNRPTHVDFLDRQKENIFYYVA